MSSNAGTVINRTNQHSPFFNALSSRNSKSIPELYSAENNSEPTAFSKVEVETSSSVGYSRTVRCVLPRYGLLNKLYVHSSFGPGTHATISGATHQIQSVPFIGAAFCSEYRLMYAGSVLARLHPETIIANLWKHGTQREKSKLVELLGAFENIAAGTPSAGKFSASSTVANKSRWAVGTGQDTGICEFYVPLDFWFSSKWSNNRPLDLSILAGEVTLEMDIEASSNCFILDGSSTTLPPITNVSAICYLSEQEASTESAFRSLTYNMSSPLTQIAYDTDHIIAAGAIAHTYEVDTVIDIKLNAFQGLVQKLVVYVTEADNFATNRHRMRPLNIKEIQLKSTGSNIVNLDKLDEKEDILESYHNGGDFYGLAQTDYVGELIQMNPNNIHELVFKRPYDFSPVSNTGAISLGQMSVPTLRIKMNGKENYGFTYPTQHGYVGTASGSKPLDVHVIAYYTTLISYNTNSAGSTSIRQIMS